MEDSFSLWILATSAWFFLLSLSQNLTPFHLKETLSDFSFAYPNCQYHYSGALGPLLGNIRVTWTQAMWYCKNCSDTQDILITKWLNWRVASIMWTDWTKGKMAWNCSSCITLRRIVWNLKFKNCLFLEIPEIFRTWLNVVTNHRERNKIKGTHVYHACN